MSRTKHTRMLMDWLKLENRIRDALTDWALADPRDRVAGERALFEISDAIGDETLRGYPIDDATELRGLPAVLRPQPKEVCR